MLDDATLDELRGYDAIMLGAIGPAIGDTRMPRGVLERGLLLRLRFGLDLYVNYRPFTGVKGSLAEGCDVRHRAREHRGALRRRGRRAALGTPHEVATQGSVNTRFGVERCVRYAFERAAVQDEPRLTLVHKTNVLTFAGDLWQRVVTEVASEFPEVAVDYHHVDAACIYLVEQPARYGVIVTDNLFGDILSDLAGAVTGGIGFAASANLNPARTGAVALRAGARRRARHRRDGPGQPAGGRVLGRVDARAPRRDRGRTAGRRRRWQTLRVTPRRSVRAGVTRAADREVVDAHHPTKKIWMDGKLVDWRDATIHVLSHTLHYGTGAFEGIRAYKTPQGPAIFRLRDHMARLLRSCKILMIDVPYTLDELCEAAKDVVRVNELLDGCYIRPLVYLGYGEMGVNPLGAPSTSRSPPGRGAPTSATRARATACAMKISSWVRHHPNAMPTAAKSVGGYVNSSLAKVEAIKAGYDEAIMLGPDGRVSECTGENLFIVRDGQIITPAAL